ncbi:MAG: diguanylate cyclase [Desulfobacterales bacterium]|nr:diguanylate cyclase [Desulfobacterales bacterium]
MRKARILVIDGEQIIGSSIKAELEPAGHTVKIISPETEALDTAFCEPHDMVFIQQGVPDSTCHEIAKAAREHSKAAIILVCSELPENKKQRKTGIGEHEIMHCSLEPSELRAMVEKHLKTGNVPAEIPASPRLLIVDDDNTILYLMTEILNDKYETSVTSSPSEALQMLENNPYEILVSDLRMREMDGMELIRSALNIRPRLVPIAITGYASKDVIVEAFKEGVYDFIEKPFTPGIVLQSIGRAWRALRAEFENQKLLYEMRAVNEAIQRAHDQLERRVEERTRELVQVNGQLSRELEMRKLMEQRISEALDLNQKIIASSNLGITAYKASGQCILANEASGRIMGFSQKEILQQNFNNLNAWEECGLLAAAKDVIDLGTVPRDETDTGTERQLEIHTKNACGEPLWLDCRFVSFILDREKHLLLVVDDITDRKKVENEIRHIALHDSLTGLPNRILFFDRMSQALCRGSRYNVSVGLLFIDVDGFKSINDTFGHDAGDKFLQEAARLFKSNIRESDTASRLGGDEFAVIVQELHTRNDAEIVAKRLIKSISQPILVTSKDYVTSSLSIGISTYPIDGQEPDILLQKADEAMYRVKKSTKNNYLFYDSS